jgi:hypothetical protein
MKMKSTLYTRLRALLAGVTIESIAIEEADVTGDVRLLRLNLDATRTIEIGGEDREGNLVLALLTKVTEPAWTDADDPTTELTKLLAGRMVTEVRVNHAMGGLAIFFSGDDGPGLVIQYVTINRTVIQRESI